MAEGLARSGGRAVVAGLLLLGVVVLPASPAAAAADPPRALPQNATAADLKWQPTLDYDTDSCYNVPAIGPDGRISEGLDNQNTTNTGDCRDQSDLDNTNAYSRQRCNSGWCVYLYDYYFEKDVMTQNVAGPGAGGHVHDWEHIAVWVRDDKAEYVATSAHGHYEIRGADQVRWDGTHPKIVYHKDGTFTHAFRFATEGDEPPENHSGQWRRSTLVSYNGFPSGLRDKLFGHDFGSATIGIKDDTFASNLESANTAITLECMVTGTGATICSEKEKTVIEFDFDYGRDEGSPGDPNPPPDPGGDDPEELTGAKLRVMPLGDSITHGIGSSTGAGYRLPLQASLTRLGAAVDMVGTLNDGPSGTSADLDHEGHSGRRIDEIAHFAACAVPRYRPNLVTLHAGTNDMNQDFALSSAPQRLGDLIDQVLKDAPEATVLVATLVPSTKDGLQPRIDSYNARIPAIVKQRRDQGKHVLLVDMGAVSTADLAQPAHPDDNGYLKIAEAFTKGVLDADREGWLKDPGAEGTSGGCATQDAESALGPGWRALGVIAPGMSQPAGHTDLVELNGDNRGDYVRIAADGSVRAALNTPAEPGQPHWVDQGIISPGRGHGPEAVRFADVNGDGRDDYLLVGEAGSVRAWQNNGPGGADGPYHWSDLGVIAPGVSGIRREALRFADVNGDGRDDYLRTSDTGAIHAYINTQTSAGVIHWVERLNWAPGVWYGSRDKLRLADVNGDRKADYLMVDSTGRTHAYFNDGGGGGGGFTPYLNFVNATGYPGDKSTFRDISGDGKADYVVIYDGGSIRAWLNRGGNTGGS
ncbi:NPP1 family protein [Nonomuraea lactucae]|uniref:NPP1 family protein n=1 Tax=Nonomuraea lactucae TaxID=2249762 RepID=UPI000DE25B4D|nr:NPP1 family protein [Nonomuraea lactucae]